MLFGFELSSEEGVIKDSKFGVEFYAVSTSFVGNTFKSPHEIQMPEGSAEFSSGPDSKKTLTIDANGGTFPTKGGVSSYVMELPERMPMRTDEIPIPEKEGFEFQKWTGVYNDGMELNAGEHIALSEDIRLKANWTPISTPSPPPTLTPTLFPESTSTPDEDPVITPEITVTPEPTTAPELAISPSEDFSDASQQDTDLVLDETDTFDDSSEMK